MNPFNVHEQILNFAVDVGELMLKSGAETYRVEDTISRILESNHFKTVNTFVIPTGIMVTITGDSFPMCTKVVRVKDRTTRLDRIEKLNQLSRDYVSGTITLEEATKLLSEITNSSGYSAPCTLLWIGLSCAFVSVMFKGGAKEFILSFFIGLLLAVSKQYLSCRQIVNFFVHFICALLVGFCSMGCNILFQDKINIEPIVIGCIMPLLPGVSFTTAVRDAIGDELLSGISRGVEALLIAVAIAAGIGVSFAVSYKLGGML